MVYSEVMPTLTGSLVSRPASRERSVFFMPQIEAPWCKVPMYVGTDPALTLGDLRVYMALDYMAGKRGWFYDPQAKVAEVANVSLDTCQRAIEKLRQRGYISTVQLGLKDRRVLRYALHARTINVETSVQLEELRAQSYDRTDAVTTPAPERSLDDRTDAVTNTTDVPQTSTTDVHSRPRARDTYLKAFPSAKLRPIIEEELCDLDNHHPSECIEWAFRSAAGSLKPSLNYARAVFNACEAEGHGPRVRRKNANARGTVEQAESPFTKFGT